MSIQPISKDGFIDPAWFKELAREIDKFAQKEGLKANEIYFTPKVLPVYDKSKERKDGDAFTKKRALVIKMKKRMPPAGSRTKMVITLRLYKGIDDPELGFAKDIKLALKAISQHNKLAEKETNRIKAEAKKRSQRANKEFDKNLECFIEEILKDEDGDVLDGVDYAVGQSMMGKTLIVALPNGGYVSIGKADEAKFEAAQNSESGDDEDEDDRPRKKKSKKSKKDRR